MFLVRILVIIILLLIIISLVTFGIRLVKFNPINQVPYEEIVRPMPQWVKKANLPLLTSDISYAIYPYIYLPEDQYAEFTTMEVSPWLESVLVHEMSHLISQEESHPLILGLKYLFSKEARLGEELESIEDQMGFLKGQGEDYPTEWKAGQLAGREYGKMVSYTEAIEILTDLWQEAEALAPVE